MYCGSTMDRDRMVEEITDESINYGGRTIVKKFREQVNFFEGEVDSTLTPVL